MGNKLTTIKDYQLVSAYSKKSAAIVLKTIAALLSSVRAGAKSPIKLKQQTIDYLAVSEVAVLRKSYPNINTLYNKSREVKKLISAAIASRDELKIVVGDLTLHGGQLSDAEITFYAAFTRGDRCPLIKDVLVMATSSDYLKILAEETLTLSEFASFQALAIRFLSEYSKPLVAEGVARKVDRIEKVERRVMDVNQAVLEPAQLVETAQAILTKPSAHRWEAVSCALALATGRRMVEVHLLGQFWLPDDEEWATFANEWNQQIGISLPERSKCLAFKGQAKGHARKVGDVVLKDVTWVFPTLVSPELILAGIDYLRIRGKRLEAGTPEKKVNQLYSRYLSEEVKRSWHVSPDLAECTYHKFRAAYFCTVSERMELNPLQFAHAAQLLTGDGDAATIQSYQRYKIQEAAIA